MSVSRERAAGGPEVSVVIAVHGAEEALARTLRALRENTEALFEIVLVDNASPGQLGDRLAREAGPATRVLRNARNVGFGPACNQGARAAAAPLLVFLNSDAWVRPGWLQPLREALGRPSVGAAVPMLLNPDGSLQESGALLFGDAVTELHGNGGRPEDPAFAFPRTVEYGSAACLAIPADLFREVGGFDPAYAPLFFEDVDLCLRLRTRGWRVRYEPRSRVTHVRGASMPDDAAKSAHWSRSRGIFASRWHELLCSHPPRPRGNAGSPDARLLSRDADVTGRLAVLPGSETAEPGSRLSRLLDALLDGWPEARITLLAPGSDAERFARFVPRGLEVDASAPEGFFASRAFLLDAVLAPGDAAAESAALLRELQPQAALVTEFPSPLDLERRLAAAGVLPGRGPREGWSR